MTPDPRETSRLLVDRLAWLYLGGFVTDRELEVLRAALAEWCARRVPVGEGFAGVPEHHQGFAGRPEKDQPR